MIPSAERVLAQLPNHTCFQSNLEIDKFMEELVDHVVPHIIITDPPYPLKLGKGVFARSQNYSKLKDGAVETYDKISLEKLGKFYYKCFDVLHEDGLLFTMTNEANLEHTLASLLNAGFQIRNKIIWVKCQNFSEGLAMGRHFLNGYEYMIYATKGDSPPINDRMNVLVKVPPKNRGQNAKPEELYAHVLECPLMAFVGIEFGTPIVVDMFAGSDPLTRCAMKGLIPPCTTISNLYGSSANNPAQAGAELKSTLFDF